MNGGEKWVIHVKSVFVCLSIGLCWGIRVLTRELNILRLYRHILHVENKLSQAFLFLDMDLKKREQWLCKINSFGFVFERNHARINSVRVNCVHDLSYNVLKLLSIQRTCITLSVTSCVERRCCCCGFSYFQFIWKIQESNLNPRTMWTSVICDLHNTINTS